MTLERSNDAAFRGEARSTVGGLVDQVAGLRAQIAALEAAETRALAALGDLVGAQIMALPADQRSAALPLRDASARLGARVRQSDRTIQVQIDTAHATVNLFPTTVAAWEAGEISRGHVRVIVDHGGRIADDDARAGYETEVLRVAREESVARTRPVAERLAEMFDPRTLAERHRDARTERKVRVTRLPDGMARLIADLPAVLAHGIMARLTDMASLTPVVPDTGAVPSAALTARIADWNDAGSILEVTVTARLRRSAGADEPTWSHDVAVTGTVDVVWSPPTPVDTSRREQTSADPDAADTPDAADAPVDERTMDQRRADLLADLLLTAAPAAADAEADLFDQITASIQITIPVLTLIDPDNAPGHTPAELDGRIPIDPDTARTLAANAPGWDRVLYHPVHGTILDTDRYRPTDAQKRFLRARDQRCRFPGCTHPARSCDLDHTDDHARGGETTVCNLECLCKRHHVLKHATAWSIRQLPAGLIQWTDPDGRIYTDTPPPIVGFTSPAVADLLAKQRRTAGLFLHDPTPAPF